MSNNLYYNKQLLSGICKVPRLTQSEYDALTTKPEFWILKDSSGSYKRLNADEVLYDLGGGQTSDVQTELGNKVSKSGDTITGDLTVEGSYNSETTLSDADIRIGNKIPSGTVGNKRGILRIRDDGNHEAILFCNKSLTNDCYFQFPNQSGTFALTTDISSEIQRSILRSKIVSTGNAKYCQIEVSSDDYRYGHIMVLGGASCFIGLWNGNSLVKVVPGTSDLSYTLSSNGKIATFEGVTQYTHWLVVLGSSVAQYGSVTFYNS